MEGDKEDMLRQECAGDRPSQTTWYMGKKKSKRTQGDGPLFIKKVTLCDLTDNIIFESKLYLSPKWKQPVLCNGIKQ